MRADRPRQNEQQQEGQQERQPRGQRQPASGRTVIVWDRPVRLLHGALIGLVAAAWWSGDSEGAVHPFLGYGVGLVIALRLGWSVIGGGHARLASGLRRPRPTVDYLRGLLDGRAPRYLGHNPAGAWMVVALLGCLTALVVTGWLYTTDWLWGYAWLSGLHAALGWLLVGLVTIHVIAALVMSWWHRENLVAAMIHGRKRAPPADRSG